MVNFVIVTHGEFGAYLVEAAESIVGRQADGVAAISISARLSVDEVRRRVEGALRELHGDDGVVVCTDIPGGTPSNVVLLAAKDMPRVAVLSGLNLYMLISGFGSRRALAFDALAAKMHGDGQRSIRDMKAALLSKAHR